MRTTLTTSILTAVVAVLGVAAPAHAIVYGQPDGDRHRQTGSYAIQTPDGFRSICSGTLISPTVFLTASHCTAAAEANGFEDAWVSFDEHPTATSPHRRGTAFTHPEFGFSGPGGRSDPHDIAVIVLDEPVAGITPAKLPGRGLLDRMSARTLKSAAFTAVGYGAVRESRKQGPQGIGEGGSRRSAEQHAVSLQPSWLELSMNQATGDGGTCFGDSGGPHFLGGPASDLVVSITVTGDAVCKATDKTYRLDTASARAFLDDFVALP
jgi:hypothetical protein